MVIGKIKEETKKIKFSEDEIKKIYNKAEEEANSINNLYKIKLQEMQKQLKKVESSIEEIYQDKINKLIQVEDFKIIYLKKQKEREKIVDEFKKASNMQSKVDLKEIRQIAEDLLNMKEPNKLVLQELIKKIEFDTNKNISVKLTFKNTI